MEALLLAPVERRTLRWSELGLATRSAVVVFSCVCTLIGFECASRCYWRLVRSVSVARTDEIWQIGRAHV